MPYIKAHNSLLMTPEALMATPGTRHLTSRELADEITLLPKRTEFSDAAALTVASHYAGPDASGLVMAQLSTTGTVIVGELLDAIHAEYTTRAAGDPTAKRHLDLLSTWALNHPSRTGDPAPESPADELRLFAVTLTHPDLDGPFVADLCASSASAAQTRVRAAAMHHYGHAELLTGGTCVAEDQGPYVSGMLG